MQTVISSEPVMRAHDSGTARGPQLTDQELIVRVLRRDEAALGAIYDRYHRVLYAIALRITGDRWVAEEVIQDVFHAVWRAAGGFLPDGNLAAWLISIVRHRAIDATRSRTYRARTREYMLDEVQIPTSTARADEQADRQILRLTMREALAELSPTQRQVLDLAYYGGLTQVEIATRLGVPLGTVKSRLRLGLEQLRQHLRHVER
jgi:RNA polymerase sigma-70 factor (ECF subfamily)